MRVSVILEKQARISVDLQGINAVEVFRQLTTMLMDKTVGESKGKKLDKAIPHSDIQKAIERVALEHITENIETHKKESIQNTSNENIPRTLVMVKCPECGNIATPLMYVRDGKLLYDNRILNCKNCQSLLPITDLKPAQYSCPNCGTSAYFYVMGDLKEVYCKDCKSPIDLVWHEEKKKYLSANLIR